MDSEVKAYKFLTLFSPSSFPSLVTILASCLKTAHKSNPKIILFLKKKERKCCWKKILPRTGVSTERIYIFWLWWLQWSSCRSSSRYQEEMVMRGGQITKEMGPLKPATDMSTTAPKSNVFPFSFFSLFLLFVYQCCGCVCVWFFFLFLSN